ncbi:MAG: hypothetical protein JO002_16925 [Burkholderiaceae bacterium]|nr:hypothetical protein [Burkholderiaceae bacterium]
MEKPADFDTTVFLNCPADERYTPLLRAIVFTVLICDFTPRSALQELDGGTVRLDKIRRLIACSRLGIHDISRTEVDKRSGLPRFNMPFELGLDLGARAFGAEHLTSKQVLILDSEQYRFQQFLSDIAGQDIAAHKGHPELAIEKVRAWLSSLGTAGHPLPGPTHILQRYRGFQSELPETCHTVRLEPDMLDLNDFINLASNWLNANA